MLDAFNGGRAFGGRRLGDVGGEDFDLDGDLADAGQGAQGGFNVGLDGRGDGGLDGGDLEGDVDVVAGDLDAFKETKGDDVPAESRIVNLGERGANQVFGEGGHDINTDIYPFNRLGATLI